MQEAPQIRSPIHGCHYTLNYIGPPAKARFIWRATSDASVEFFPVLQAPASRLRQTVPRAKKHFSPSDAKLHAFERFRPRREGFVWPRRSYSVGSNDTTARQLDPFPWQIY